MTISQTQLDQILSEQEIQKFWLGYFQETFREQVQEKLLEIFEHSKNSSGYSRSDLAKKIGRRPEQVTRWLSAPTNLESDTISDLALGMGFVPKLTFEPAVIDQSRQSTTSPNELSNFVSELNVSNSSDVLISVANQARELSL